MKKNVILLQSETQTFCFPSKWVNQYVVCRFELHKTRKRKTTSPKNTQNRKPKS